MTAWLLSDKQLANITPKIKRTIKWLKRGGMLPSSGVPEIELGFHSSFGGQWWLHINGHGGGATYEIDKSHKRWKLI